MRTMSLESGRILWRLNHVLLPEPGSPIARTTAPLVFLASCGAGGRAVLAAAASVSSGAVAGPGGLAGRPTRNGHRRSLARRLRPPTTPTASTAAVAIAIAARALRRLFPAASLGS